MVSEENTPGTAGGPGGRDRMLDVKSRKNAWKSSFWVSPKWVKSNEHRRERERNREERKSVLTMVSRNAWTKELIQYSIDTTGSRIRDSIESQKNNFWNILYIL